MLMTDTQVRSSDIKTAVFYAAKDTDYTIGVVVISPASSMWNLILCANSIHEFKAKIILPVHLAVHYMCVS